MTHRKVFEDAYTVQQILVGLGFDSGDIYVGCVDHVSAKNVLTVGLMTQGKKFYVTVAEMGADVTPSEVNQGWQRFAEKIAARGFSDEELHAMRVGSPFARPEQLTSLALTLKERGFEL